MFSQEFGFTLYKATIQCDPFTNYENNNVKRSSTTLKKNKKK